MGRPQNDDFESDQEGNYFQQNDGKPIMISSVGNDDSEITADSDAANVDLGNVDDDDKADCNCNKGKPKITYGPEQVVKGKPETYIHRQPKIIVQQPPTHVRIEHPPTIIHPSTIVFRRRGKTIRRPVIYQHLPQDVQVRPVYVKVIKPIEKKILVGEKVAPCPKSAKQYKVQEQSYKYQNQDQEQYDDSNLEYGPESYVGEHYSESFNEHESYHAHLNTKETTSQY